MFASVSSDNREDEWQFRKRSSCKKKSCFFFFFFFKSQHKLQSAGKLLQHSHLTSVWAALHPCNNPKPWLLKLGHMFVLDSDFHRMLLCHIYEGPTSEHFKVSCGTLSNLGEHQYSPHFIFLSPHHKHHTTPASSSPLVGIVLVLYYITWLTFYFFARANKH